MNLSKDAPVSFCGSINSVLFSKLTRALEQTAARSVVVSTKSAIAALNAAHQVETLVMYNPPWNAWFALSSQAARICFATQAGMLRGIAKGTAKAKTETDRMVIENVGAAPAAARKSNQQQRVARKGLAVATKRDRRNRNWPHHVRSSRVDHRVRKIRKRRAA